ncbi:DNA cytosine methyltransferase, partial [Pontibacterium sp.]|uniref:DNA cytosine methyltransferase n=1 Tax=Pontibacterium sp. TaxID=2036026 RepID=UPI003564E9D0
MLTEWQKQYMNHRPKIIDLFCGCGGFGLGAELAGFDTLAAVDIDQTLQSAYKFNFPNTHVINGDLSLLDKDAWKLITHNQEIDGVIGGPPCQGFSRMGSGNVNDPRRSLLAHFFRNINILQPKFFVMENVEGLLDQKNIQGLHEAIDSVDSRYTVLEPIVIDASLYGAPTKRLRVIVVGYDPKFIEPLSNRDFQVSNAQITTVKDAIVDIPSPLQMSSSKNDLGWKSYREIKNLSNYAKLMRAVPIQNIGNTEAKEMLLEGLTSGHFQTS